MRLSLNLRSADGGDRTHTHLRELDFESSASANSATSAFVRRQLVAFLPRNARKSGVQAPGGGLQDSAFLTTDYTDFTDFLYGGTFRDKPVGTQAA
jgi:hypothetical protein